MLFATSAVAAIALLAAGADAKPKRPPFSRIPVSPASLGHEYPEHVLKKRNNDNQYLPPAIEGFVEMFDV